MVAEAETDSTKARPIVQQLENSQSVPTNETAKGQAVPKENANTENPVSSPTANAKPTDISLDFPIFCDWAPSVCQAAKVVITKPQEWEEDIKAAYDDAVDYVINDNPELEKETELDIPEQEAPDIDTDINFGGNCPQSLYAPYSFFGLSGQIEFSFQPVCQIADFIKPVVITISAFASAMIIAGVRTEDD